jgi:hypothetical protein
VQSQQSVVPYRTACNSVNLLREYAGLTALFHLE